MYQAFKSGPYSSEYGNIQSRLKNNTTV